MSGRVGTAYRSSYASNASDHCGLRSVSLSDACHGNRFRYPGKTHPCRPVRYKYTCEGFGTRPLAGTCREEEQGRRQRSESVRPFSDCCHSDVQGSADLGGAAGRELSRMQGVGTETSQHHHKRSVVTQSQAAPEAQRTSFTAPPLWLLAASSPRPCSL